MKKKILTIALAAILAESQALSMYAAGSPGTNPAVSDNGQTVVGDTILELMQSTETTVEGLSDNVIDSIKGINNGNSLNELIFDVNLDGYYALVGTQVIKTKDVRTSKEKTGVVEVPLYVPNIVDGLREVKILFYDNRNGTWTLIQPNKIDTASKMVWFNIPNSGILSVIYKR